MGEDTVVAASPTTADVVVGTTVDVVVATTVDVGTAGEEVHTVGMGIPSTEAAPFVEEAGTVVRVTCYKEEDNHTGIVVELEVAVVVDRHGSLEAQQMIAAVVEEAVLDPILLLQRH
jgi:hypothetical protein